MCVCCTSKLRSFVNSALDNRVNGACAELFINEKAHTIGVLYGVDRYQTNVKQYTARHKQSKYDIMETEVCKPQIHRSL
jgi:hypothetical protein